MILSPFQFVLSILNIILKTINIATVNALLQNALIVIMAKLLEITLD